MSTAHAWQSFFIDFLNTTHFIFNFCPGIANLSLIPIELDTYYFDACAYDEGPEDSALFYRRVCWWTQPNLEKRSPEYIKVLFDQVCTHRPHGEGEQK